MAKSWADMSKEERQEAGGNKKAYNKSTGQARYADGGSLAHKATVQQPAESPAETPVTPQATQERSEAKERAQNYSANGEKINKGTGPNNHYSAADNMSPLQQQMLDQKKAKAAASGGGGDRDAFIHKMAVGNAMNKNTGQFKDEYAQMISGMSSSEKNAFRKEIFDKTQDFKKNGIDMGYSGPTKQEIVGPMGTLHANVTEGYRKAGGVVTGPKGTGNRYEDGTAVSSEGLAKMQDAVQGLLQTGHDFSRAEVLRHKHGGQKLAGFEGIYDSYGGYDNWYNNHSMYSEGGFKGSNDIKSQAEITQIELDRAKKGNEFRQAQSDRMDNYWNSLQ